VTIAQTIDRILEEYDFKPILVDLGASGGAPHFWKPLARHATYIGFDPDLREVRRDTAGGYAVGLVINKAICADADVETVPFFLTQSPYCSSMLRPNAAALASYSFWSLFQVERMLRVPATTLDKVLDGEGLAQIDWLKVDVQGADLRVYLSISDERRRRLLAVDMEPGLLDAYEGEDLFVDVHRRMRAEGFWLSNLNVMGARRISKSVLQELGIESDMASPSGLRVSPGWCEARYLRTAEYHGSVGHGKRELVLAWAFAMIDGQYGHALELAHVLRGQTGDATLSARLWDNAVQALAYGSGTAAATNSLVRRVARKLRGIARRFV
jgi:FkbM family methyltransferase